jgi:hypothetical protein
MRRPPRGAEAAVARETETSTNNEASEPSLGDRQALRRSRLESRAERQAKREELRKQQAAASFRRKWLPWIVIGTLIVLAIAAFIMIEVVPKTAVVTGVEKFGNLSRDHVTGPQDYPQVPPVGGAHSATWENCGVYDTPVPKEMAVHSMEHGAVWITYRPDLPADQVQQLRDLARGKSYVLLSPWTDTPPLPAPVVASAWGLQVKVDSASDDRLAQFIRNYANGTQTPEPGAVCSGGAGSPMPNP